MQLWNVSKCPLCHFITAFQSTKLVLKPSLIFGRQWSCVRALFSSFENEYNRSFSFFISIKILKFSEDMFIVFLSELRQIYVEMTILKIVNLQLSMNCDIFNQKISWLLTAVIGREGRFNKYYPSYDYITYKDPTIQRFSRLCILFSVTYQLIFILQVIF